MRGIRTRLAGLALVASAAISSGAQAVIINVQDDILGSRHVAAGERVSGTFDLSSHLNGNSVVDWARVTFHFSDDYDPLRYLGRFGSYRTGYHTDRVNDAETALASTLGQGAYGSSSYFNHVLRQSRTIRETRYRREYYRVSYSCGFLGLRTCYRTQSRTVPYTVTRRVTDIDHRYGHTGPFTVSYLLNGSALLNLVDAGMADFSVQSRRGDFNFNYATLSASVSQVPEPAALGLLGFGALILFVRRNRRLRRAQ